MNFLRKGALIRRALRDSRINLSNSSNEDRLGFCSKYQCFSLADDVQQASEHLARREAGQHEVPTIHSILVLRSTLTLDQSSAENNFNYLLYPVLRVSRMISS